MGTSDTVTRTGDIRTPILGGVLDRVPYARKPSLARRLHWAKHHTPVSGTLLHVLLALMTFTNVNGWAYPSIMGVGARMDGGKRSKRWLRDRLHTLERLGLIRIYVSAGYATERGATNAYRVLWRPCDCDPATYTEHGDSRPLTRAERRAAALAARRARRSYPHGGSRHDTNPINPPLSSEPRVTYPTLWGEFDPSGDSPPG